MKFLKNKTVMITGGTGSFGQTCTQFLFKNDVKKVLGHPSTIGTFENSIWIYIERTRTKGKMLQFGRNVINKNNVLALEFDEYGILTKKDFYDKTKINKINFTKYTTTTISREKSFVYSFLSSLRQKINAPAKSKKP